MKVIHETHRHLYIRQLRFIESIGTLSVLSV